jgi:hypothetical protein
MCRAIRVVNPFLAMEDRRRQYVEHVKAMRNRPAVIDNKQPIAPTRIENHRKRQQYMQKILLQVGDDNIKLICKSRNAAPSPDRPRMAELPSDPESIDWVKAVSDKREARPVSSFGMQSPLAHKAKLGELRPAHEPEQGTVPMIKSAGNANTSLGKNGRNARLDEILSETLNQL